jgi:hypothetical protein
VDIPSYPDSAGGGLDIGLSRRIHLSSILSEALSCFNCYNSARARALLLEVLRHSLPIGLRDTYFVQFLVLPIYTGDHRYGRP